uniref:Thioredoxin-dependent peroxide reductase, mitochondrial n=1 Tax=Otolemur garnettii TaxID=30611 RepID=H0XUT8_OTOGA
MAAAVGRLLRGSVARHVNAISGGISAPTTLRPAACGRTHLMNILWSGSSPAFSTSSSYRAPAVTQHAPYTFVCPTEIVAFSDKANEFHDVNCEVVGVSVDSHFTHLAWINTPRKNGGLGHMNIALLSDLTKQISRDYGVLLEGPGLALRGLFIIDPNGVIKHLSVNDLPVGRSVEETLRLVKAFQFVEAHGEVCPANWTPDSPTIKPNPTASKEYFEKVNQ